MELRLQRELSRNLWDEILPLLVRNNEDVGVLGSIEPDRETYDALEEKGALRCYTARTETGLLVGYCIMVVGPSLYRVGMKCANQDTIYILRQYRHGAEGIRLLRYADEQLAAEGVEYIVRQSTGMHDIGKLLQAEGYVHTHDTYMRRIDRG